MICYKDKLLLQEKKRAFSGRDKTQLKNVNNRIKIKIEGCKSVFKDKVESKFRSHDSKGMWDGMKSMVGYNCKKTTLTLDKGNENNFANDLNYFTLDLTVRTSPLRQTTLGDNSLTATLTQ